MHYRVCHVCSPIASKTSSIAPPTAFPAALRVPEAIRTWKITTPIPTFHPPPQLRGKGSVSSHRIQRKKRRQPLHRRAHFLLKLRDLFSIQSPAHRPHGHHAPRPHRKSFQFQHAANFIPRKHHFAVRNRQHAARQLARVAQHQ